MSVMCRIARISPSLLREIRADSAELWELTATYGDVTQLAKLRRENAPLDALFVRSGIPMDAWSYGPELVLEKKWAGIHYLLCGEYGDPSDDVPTVPLAGVIFGHHLFYEEPGGAPPRFSLPEEVARCWEALEPISGEALQARYATADMGGVYPHRWREGPDGFNYLGPEFASLRALYRTAAQNGDGVLIRWSI